LYFHKDILVTKPCKNPIILTFWGVALLLSGCGGANWWMGTVDTAFHYRSKDNSTIVHEVKPGTLSRKAGLQPGDILLSVDGTDVSNAASDTVRSLLIGPVGTDAVLMIKHGDEIVEITVERSSISK
jgi:C-terminal processing protease CtpA/Prc